MPVPLTREQRAQVESEVRRGKVEKRVYLRGRALLMMADGVPANRVAWELHVHERTGGEVFVELLDCVAAAYPNGKGHIVCDNQSSHDTDDVLDWLEDHPNWTIHFTPKHGSWLNQVEQFFSILQRRVMARGSFESKQDLADKVTRYILWHNQRSKPFRWTYRPASWGNSSTETQAA